MQLVVSKAAGIICYYTAGPEDCEFQSFMEHDNADMVVLHGRNTRAAAQGNIKFGKKYRAGSILVYEGLIQI